MRVIPSTNATSKKMKVGKGMVDTITKQRRRKGKKTHAAAISPNDTTDKTYNYSMHVDD